MTSDKYSEALALQQKGYSMQEIGQELGMGKSSVHRLLSSPPDYSSDPETDSETQEETFLARAGTDGNGNSAAQVAYPADITPLRYELERLRMEQEHERYMEDAATRRVVAQNTNLNLTLQNAFANAEKIMAQKEQAQKQHILNTQDRKLVAEYKELYVAFEAQVEEATWERDDWEKFRSDCSDLIETVETFAAEKLHLVSEDLVVFCNLQTLDNLASGIIEGHTGWFKSAVLDTTLSDEADEEFEGLQENIYSIGDSYGPKSL